MEGRIRQLPDGVIDQIAAGEVVERPSSILKELLENAVDASASRIEAQVFGAFPFSLRVSDDGAGMTAEEGGGMRWGREAGSPPGTTVEVSELFGNVPARLKFLKTPRTEMAHLWEVFHGVGISRQGLFFRMQDGRTEVSSQGGGGRH